MKILDIGIQFICIKFFSLKISESTDSVPNDDSKYRLVPVRAVFNGEYKDHTGQMKDFEIEVDFYDFRSTITDYEVFQTPSTVFCSNRKKNKDLPYIGGVFGYSEEVVTERYNLEYLKV